MTKKLSVVVAQINPTVGDIVGNRQKIINAAQTAHQQFAANLIVFPETALSGYPIEDLLFETQLHQQIAQSLTVIQAELPANLYLLIGIPHKEGTTYFNAAVLMDQQAIIGYYYKQQLPNYGVFDEQRYFTAGNKSFIFAIAEYKIGVLICEDLWVAAPAIAAKQQGAELLISLNASPFEQGKSSARQQILKQRAQDTQLPIIYTNLVGGQDELVFDGGSMVVDHQGHVLQQAAYFQEQLMLVQLQRTVTTIEPVVSSDLVIPTADTIALTYQALVLAVHDYVQKNRFQKVLIALSGGIDSALTLAVAYDALGKAAVNTLYLPSRFSSVLSHEIASSLADQLAATYQIISIEPILLSYQQQLQRPLTSLTIENLQARCRAVLIMAIANQDNLLVLTTSNKSELAVGYTTLYGDMIGGFAVLKDIPKTMVYQLAHYRAKISNIFPAAVLTRPPTAELAFGQQDSDTLPPYPILDEIIQRYVVERQSATEIIAAGFASTTVKQVIQLIQASEYKRRQAAPGVKVTQLAFGRERRYPITAQLSIEV